MAPRPGIAATLARTALEYARDENLKVDVICPLVTNSSQKNPEFSRLIAKNTNPQNCDSERSEGSAGPLLVVSTEAQRSGNLLSLVPSPSPKEK